MGHVVLVVVNFSIGNGRFDDRAFAHDSNIDARLLDRLNRRELNSLLVQSAKSVVLGSRAQGQLAEELMSVLTGAE